MANCERSWEVFVVCCWCVGLLACFSPACLPAVLCCVEMSVRPSVSQSVCLFVCGWMWWLAVGRWLDMLSITYGYVCMFAGRWCVDNLVVCGALLSKERDVFGGRRRCAFHIRLDVAQASTVSRKAGDQKCLTIRTPTKKASRGLRYRSSK